MRRNEALDENLTAAAPATTATQVTDLAGGLAADSAFEASDSVIATFKFDGKLQSMKIDGRGPSILGSKQGDHVTAYALVKKGFARTLQGLELDSEEGLADLKEGREKIYKFISQIAAIDKDSRDSLYAEITAILQDYNKSRFKKSEISDIEKFAKAEQREGSELAPNILKHMEKEKLSNGRLIQSSLERMAETLMTFYNQASNTAYLQINGFKAPSNEGPTVTAALNFLDNFKNNYQQDFLSKKGELEDKKATLQKEIQTVSSVRIKSQKELEVPKIEEQLRNLEQDLHREFFASAVKKISDLFFYPEIRDKDALKKHEGETTALSKPKATPRNNSEEDLTSALAKHMHIVFAAFPELTTQFDHDDLIRAFVNRVITGPYQVKVKDRKSEKDKNEARKHGWPSICERKDKDATITKVSNAVVEAVKSLQTESEQNLYSKTEGFKSVESSNNPSSHVSSGRDSGKVVEEERSVASEGEEERGGGGIGSEEFQQHVVKKISDEDFLKELARRSGADKTLLQQVRTEIEGNTVLDRDELLKSLRSFGDEEVKLQKSLDNSKEKFIRSLSDVISPIILPDLSTIDPKDNLHYPEIIESIHSKVSAKGEIRLKEFHKIITEEFQKDHQSLRSNLHGGIDR